MWLQEQIPQFVSGVGRWWTPSTCLPTPWISGLCAANWKSVYPFTRGSDFVQAHVFWAQPAIEAFRRHRRNSQVQEKRAGHELYWAVGNSIRIEFATEGNAWQRILRSVNTYNNRTSKLSYLSYLGAVWVQLGWRLKIHWTGWPIIVQIYRVNGHIGRHLLKRL